MKHKRHIRILLAACLLAVLLCIPALAAGNVASAVESTWKDAADQIKTVVDNVVFPALDMVLAIAFFTKLAMAYFDYRPANSAGSSNRSVPSGCGKAS